MKTFHGLINEFADNEPSAQTKALVVQKFIDSQVKKGYKIANESSYGFRIHRDDLSKFKAALGTTHLKHTDGMHHSWRAIGLTSKMYHHYTPKSVQTNPEVFIDAGHDTDGYHYVSVG